MRWKWDDGGRAERRRFRPDVGDCVYRAIAIALQLNYWTVAETLNPRIEAFRRKHRDRVPAGERTAGLPKSAGTYDGVPPMVYGPYLRRRGWTRVDLVGTLSPLVELRQWAGTEGRFILKAAEWDGERFSRGHVMAVIDGVLHDTYPVADDRPTYQVVDYWLRKTSRYPVLR